MIKKTVSYLIVIMLFPSLTLHAQAISGTYYVGTGQTYSSLTSNSGFFRAVNTNGLSGNVTVYITSNLTENGANALNQWGNSYTITILPSNATEKIISGSVNNSLIRLNGADRVTFDGRYSGSGKYLRFRNTQGSNPTFSFLNDATYNTITYCIIESNNSNSGTPASMGAILFGSTTGSVGNDFNTISYCNIGDRSDAAGYPAYAIYSYGSTTVSRYNTDNTIINNNIYNFWKNGEIGSGITLTTGTGNNWIISGNSFYQTAVRSFTVNAIAGWNVIWINLTGINNAAINDNYIGGSSAQCGGTPWSSNSANNTIQYSGIRLSAGSTTASSVNGNQISNINISTRTAADGELTFSGILCQAGLVNIGAASANIIGNSTGNGSISIIYTGALANSQIIRGIDHRSAGSIIGNIIGSITIDGTITDSVNFDGIYREGAPTGISYITNNTIGSSTVPNSIQETSLALRTMLNGINVNMTGASNVNITGNIISNINNYSTNINSRVRGIFLVRASTPAVTISNNVICNLYTSSASTNNQPNICAIIGIMTGSTNASQIISNNTIYAMRSTSNNNTVVIGIGHTEQNSAGIISSNRIFDLTNTSTSAAPCIFGINAYWGNWNYVNNQISLTNGEVSDNISPEGIIQQYRKKVRFEITASLPEKIETAETTGGIVTKNYSVPVYEDKPVRESYDASTNGVIIQGFHDEAAVGCHLYFNTIYIGGNATTGNANSFAYVRPLTDWPTLVSMRNNIFFNCRTGGTGNHFAIGNEVNPPTNNWRSTASNYNLFVSTNVNIVGEWGLGVTRTIAQWRTSSSGDMQTWSTNTASLNELNLFTDISTGNLNIIQSKPEAWYVNGKGIQEVTVSTDFSGNPRSTTIPNGAPDLGSGEITPSGIPITADQAGVIGYNQTTTFSFANRTLASITWGNTGTLPSSLSLSYYSGANPPNNISGALYSNAYWQINATGGANYVYNMTVYYDLPLQGSIPAESNTRIAKSSDGGTTWWTSLTAGTGSGQYQLNTTNKTITIYGLNTFSLFTLTDNNLPLPVTLESFNASVSGRDVILSWTTSYEKNNKGFDIERKKIEKNGIGSDWVKAGYMEGIGNTNIRSYYQYADTKLNSAVYQYRLKQIDYNGNFEYYELKNPSEITVGSPASFQIFQNYPNPSNPVTNIDFEIPSAGKVSIKVYDIAGREVADLIDKEIESGYHTVVFNGSNLSSGIYFYRINFISANEIFIKTMKLILLK